MKTLVEVPFSGLLLSMIPVFIVIGIYSSWGLEVRKSLFALLRMILQLGAIGFVLRLIFAQNHPLILVGVVLFMLTMASWISLSHAPRRFQVFKHYGLAFVALGLGGVPCLLLTLIGVLRLSPVTQPHYFIPLAGMILANAMNGLSLAAERYSGASTHSKKEAFRAAMIPMTNAFLSIGLVSLPGVMTGQVLAGVDPLVAARYQFVIMTILYGVTGISTALFLELLGAFGAKKRGSQVSQG